MRTLAERYFAKVDQGEPDECWPWTGATNYVYGKIWDGTRTPLGNTRAALAHRVGWKLHFGPIPEGMLVCHHCDVPLCQNPGHWFLGTDRDNALDKMKKGRGRASRVSRNRGDSNPNARLTSQQVDEIRRRYTGKRGEQTQLAKEYGVTQPLVSMIVNRKVRR